MLARELSIEDIKKIRKAIPEDIELESFVHGAMCISYSGRCLLSNYLTGRDSNRGECVQACRWEYKVFENYIRVNIYRENERIRESKCFFTDIEQIQQFSKWLFLQFGGQSFIIRKSDLKENSAFYSYMYKNPSKIIEPLVSNKWRTISIILFVASLLSIMGALALVGAVSNANGLFVENMWLFFLLTPIPITSIIFGFVLKSKGYKYKKNIIVGFIMTFFLCIYGLFTFMF